MIESKKHSSKRLKTDRDDAPELTSEWFAGADLYKGMKLVKRGRPAGSGARVLISLRLDKQAIAAYRATGSKWQSRLNEVVVRSAKRLKAPAGLAKFDRLMARKGGQSRRKSDEAPKEYG
ncbi:MAG: BrnA antitoxin family protein, partial [Aestuariivirga sp.]